MFALLLALVFAALGFNGAPAMDSDPAPQSAYAAASRAVDTATDQPAGDHPYEFIDVLPDTPAPAPVADAPVVTEDGSVIEDPASYYDPCAPVVLIEGQDYTYLFEAGWTGDPTDHVEALYPPGC